MYKTIRTYLPFSGISLQLLAYTDCMDMRSTNSCPWDLFICNSYTSTNDLSGMLAALARAGGHPIHTGMAAQGGWTLAEHLTSVQTLATLQSSKWNFVVLQEQSQIPAVEKARSGGCIRPHVHWFKRSGKPVPSQSFSLPGHTGMAGRKTIFRIMKACSCRSTRVICQLRTN